MTPNKRTFKTRNRFGVLQAEEYVNLHTLIAMTRQILDDDPTNARAALVVAWVDSLGHEPTDAEFTAFCRRVGVQLLPTMVENDAN